MVRVTARVRDRLEGDRPDGRVRGDPREGLAGSTLAHLLAWDEAEFLRRTEGSAIRRIGHVRWLRNLALAAGNALRSGQLATAQEEALREALLARLDHPEDVVREQVAWSLAKP